MSKRAVCRATTDVSGAVVALVQRLSLVCSLIVVGWIHVASAETASATFTDDVLWTSGVVVSIDTQRGVLTIRPDEDAPSSAPTRLLLDADTPVADYAYDWSPERLQPGMLVTVDYVMEGEAAVAGYIMIESTDEEVALDEDNWDAEDSADDMEMDETSEQHMW